MTLDEQEREAYINNDPTAPLLARLADAEAVDVEALQYEISELRQTLQDVLASHSAREAHDIAREALADHS
jgi:hypothetical protein